MGWAVHAHCAKLTTRDLGGWVQPRNGSSQGYRVPTANMAKSSCEWLPPVFADAELAYIGGYSWLYHGSTLAEPFKNPNSGKLFGEKLLQNGFLATPT